MNLNQFIKRFLIFFLPIIFSSISFELLLRLIPNDYKLKQEIVQNMGHEAKILVLGSSHALHDVNPAYFSKKGINLANPSQTLDFDLIVLKETINKMPNLEYILLPISYFSFFKDLENSEELWRIKNYVLYFKVLKSWKISNNSELLGNNFRVNLQRLYKYYCQKKPNSVCDSSGFAQDYKLADQVNLSEEAKQTIISHEKGTIENIDKNIVYVNEIINIAREHNIKVILFTPPGSAEYVKLLKIDKLNYVVALSKSISQNNNSVFYYNFIQDSRFNDQDFYDSDHLNVNGAEKLSKILNSIISEN